jgi:hypothetical protein
MSETERPWQLAIVAGTASRSPIMARMSGERTVTKAVCLIARVAKAWRK